MKKYFILFIIPALAFLLTISCFNAKNVTVSAAFDTDADYKSAVLLEQSTGKVLYDSNSNMKLPVASVTKLMTILLTLEHIDIGQISLEDDVMVSSNASGMGGSQIFLDANKSYKLNELLKSVVVASANDSSVVLAEHIAGSEKNFVRMMNERAKELNLINTNYENCTGLPSVGGHSCAYDQAIVLSKVLKYDIYHSYASIWMEDFAHPGGRTTMMTNTNKLSRYYEGCVGGKTGSTNEAKFCLAVGAERNDVSLIAVVLGVKDSQSRFNFASELLNYGFANFESKILFSDNDLSDKTIKIKGMNRTARLFAEKEFVYVCDKNESINYSLHYHLPTLLNKVEAGQIVGNVEIVIDGVVVDTIQIMAAETHNEASIWDYVKELTKTA